MRPHSAAADAPVAAAAVAAGDEADDGHAHGDDAADDGVEDGADARDDYAEAVAEGAEGRGELWFIC